MDTNKMREQFEAWAWREYGMILWWDMNYSDVFRRNGETYLTEFLSVRWEAWQASREAVVVDLPAHKDDSGFQPPAWDHHDHGFNEGVDECRKAIEAQGLKVAL